MSNVIALRVPHRRQRLSDRTTALASLFAQHRRGPEDVFWLKENAEFLNICECTGLGVSADALENWRVFYEELPRRLAFFPQYYRFFLSIALDLEALGVSGNAADEACRFVVAEDLSNTEFSDLQRAEARRLLARRGYDTAAADPGLDGRLHGFMDRTATFSLPNKKAAYELTHIVFYLSEYGRRDPGLSRAALRSLEYAGTMAMLEQNMDLLAEICVALRYAGQEPSAVWEDCVLRGLSEFGLEQTGSTGGDDYHEYLVSSWCAAQAGSDGSSAAVDAVPTRFDRTVQEGPLRMMSSALLDLDRLRSGDWHKMRPMLYDCVDPKGRAVLDAAERATPYFDQFFEGFARARA